MKRTIAAVCLCPALVVRYVGPTTDAQTTSPASDTLRGSGSEVVITAADCTSTKVGTTIATSAIGQPVRSVTLSSPAWVEAAGGAPAHCRADGTMAPVDTNSTARPINFRVVLPASWSRRGAQIGGGGMNGSIPNLTGGGAAPAPSLLARGLATYGSDSGHQAAFGPRRGGAPPAGSSSRTRATGSPRRWPMARSRSACGCPTPIPRAAG